MNLDSAVVLDAPRPTSFRGQTSVQRYDGTRLTKRRPLGQTLFVDTEGRNARESSLSLTWIADGSVATVRAGLATVAPFLADAEIRPNDRVVTDNAEFFQGSAVIGGAYVVKFAWSDVAAHRNPRFSLTEIRAESVLRLRG